MEFNVHLCASDDDPLFDPARYHHLFGILAYLAFTHLDISYPFHILNQFNSIPTSLHYIVLRYLRGMMGTYATSVAIFS
jgi:hypothetical protein